MRIEALWQELESESQGSSAWTSRLARPDPGYPLLVAVEASTRSRALLLPVPRTAIPPRRTWPDCQGVDVLSVAMGANTYVAVRLRDPASADVFTSLAEDVASRIVTASDPVSAVEQLFDRLRRWQMFLASSREALGVEAQRGLFGELLFLIEGLVPAIGPRASVAAWVGATGANQDFQFSLAAIEVKSTTARQPEIVRVASERQLDDTGAGVLFLLVNLLDERDVPTTPESTGQTLPELVARIRAASAPDIHCLATLNDRLLQAGWLDGHAPRYETRRWALRSRRAFRIGPGFPRLVEKALPEGVGDVSYGLDLATCKSFEVGLELVLSAIDGSSRSSSGGDER